MFKTLYEIRKHKNAYYKPNIQKFDSVRHVIGRLFYFFTQFDVYCPHIVSTRAQLNLGRKLKFHL